MLLCVFLLLLSAFVCHLIKGLLTYLLTYITLTELSAVTVDEVEVAIKQLSNKSSFFDVLPVSLLKLCLPEIVYMISNLANASLNSGLFRRK